MDKQLILALVGCFFFSCGQTKEQPIANPTQIEKYFLLKDFVENQLGRLDGANVRKITRIRGEEVKTLQELGLEEWRRELHIFIQADINKASLANSYYTEEDSNSTIHRLKADEKSPIQEIKVFYEGENISQISFVSQQENFFYQSGSEGRLFLDPNSGLLSSYMVRGTQKVWFLDPNEMEVEGKILPLVPVLNEGKEN